MSDTTLRPDPVVGWAVIDPKHPDIVVTFDFEHDADQYADMHGCGSPIPVLDFMVVDWAHFKFDLCEQGRAD